LANRNVRSSSRHKIPRYSCSRPHTLYINICHISERGSRGEEEMREEGEKEGKKREGRGRKLPVRRGGRNGGGQEVAEEDGKVEIGEVHTVKGKM